MQFCSSLSNSFLGEKITNMSIRYVNFVGNTCTLNSDNWYITGLKVKGYIALHIACF